MNIYSAKAQERRRQFNKIIDGCDLVLFNKAPEVDDTLYYGGEWLGENPFEIRECEWFVNDATTPSWCCNTHEFDGTGDYPAKDEAGNDLEPPEQCDFAESDADVEVYQWFAVPGGDAEFLARHHQYVVYSEKLDLHLLAITHFGTSWDYTHMVDDFEDCYHGLEGLDEEKEVV